MFTGKPEVEGLGYAFLFRSYRPELGKWQISDPLGYPDGWNNLAYVNNGITSNVDWLGTWTIRIPGITDYVSDASASFSYGSFYNSSTNSTTIHLTVEFFFIVYSTWAPGGWTGNCDCPSCQGHHVAEFSSSGQTAHLPLEYITIIYGMATPEEISAEWETQTTAANSTLSEIRVGLDNDDKFLTTMVLCE